MSFDEYENPRADEKMTLPLLEIAPPRFHMDQYVKRKDAMLILGCSSVTLWKMTKQRKIRHYDTDFGPRYKVCDLHAYMEAKAR